MGSAVDHTALIQRAQKGDAVAIDALFAESYPVLQRIARAYALSCCPALPLRQLLGGLEHVVFDIQCGAHAASTIGKTLPKLCCTSDSCSAVVFVLP